MIRFATVGTGIAAQRFLEASLKCEELEYAAACSKIPGAARELALEYGAASCLADVRELSVAADIDAVYIDGEAGLTSDQILLLLSGGKHVLCEKLLLFGRETLKSLIQAAADHGVCLTEDLPSVYGPGFLSIRETLPRLGNITGASFQYCRYSPESSCTVPAAGAFLDAGIHCINPLVRLFGVPQQLTADPVLLKDGQDGGGVILARYSHMQAELLYSEMAGCRITNKIWGEGGKLVFQNLSAPSHIVFYSSQGDKEILSSHPDQSGMAAELREWVNQIRKNTDWKDQIADSLMAAEVVEKVVRQQKSSLPSDKWSRIC